MRMIALIRKMEADADRAEDGEREKMKMEAARLRCTPQAKAEQSRRELNRLRTHTAEIRQELELKRLMKMEMKKYVAASLELQEANRSAEEREIRAAETRRRQILFSKVVSPEIHPDWRALASAAFRDRYPRTPTPRAEITYTTPALIPPLYWSFLQAEEGTKGLLICQNISHAFHQSFWSRTDRLPSSRDRPRFELRICWSRKGSWYGQISCQCAPRTSFQSCSPAARIGNLLDHPRSRVRARPQIRLVRAIEFGRNKLIFLPIFLGSENSFLLPEIGHQNFPKAI